MKVRIYRPSKTATQSPHAKKRRWILEHEPVSGLTPEPLMGRASSDDVKSQIQLKFSSRENAVAYAEKQGWEYCLRISQVRKVRPQSYMDNFHYIPPLPDAKI